MAKGTVGKEKDEEEARETTHGEESNTANSVTDEKGLRGMAVPGHD